MIIMTTLFLLDFSIKPSAQPCNFGGAEGGDTRDLCHKGVVGSAFISVLRGPQNHMVLR